MTPIENSQLNTCHVCSGCSTDKPFPHLAPSPGASYFFRHSNIEIRLISNPTMTSKCSRGRKSHRSLTLNQKLEMITKLNGNGVSKAEICQNPYLFSQTGS